MVSEPRYQLSGQYLLREIAGEAVIIPVGENAPAGNAILEPNDTAAFLWHAFEQPRTAVQLALNEYEGDEAMIRAQVCGFVQAALGCQILKEADEV